MAADHLDDLRERLRATQEAAERIAGSIPPQGWASVDDGSVAADEIRALVTLVQGLGDLLPEELREQAREVLRQVVALLRAILDVIGARLAAAAEAGPQTPRSGGPVVENIPIA